MLFVLKLIKNGVTELLEGSAAPASDPRPATDRPRSGRASSPTRPVSAGGRSRQRSVSRGRAPPPPAAVADASGEGGEGEGKKAGKKDGDAEEEMDDETLEAAVRDLRTCMELVMKRLDIGAAETNKPPAHQFVLLHNQWQNTQRKGVSDIGADPPSPVGPVAHAQAPAHTPKTPRNTACAARPPTSQHAQGRPGVLG
jgi:hypothetical protein